MYCTVKIEKMTKIVQKKKRFIYNYLFYYVYCTEKIEKIIKLYINSCISHQFHIITAQFCLNLDNLSRNLSKQAIFAIAFVKTGGYWWVFSRYFIYLRIFCGYSHILADILHICTCI